MTHSLQSTISTSQGYPSSYGPPWQGYGLHQGGYGGFQMFPPPQFPGEGPSSPGAPRVPPGPPGNHPVNWPTSSSLTPPRQPPAGAPGRHPISLPTKWFQPPVEPRKVDGVGIMDLPPLPGISYDDYNAADESNDSSDLGVAEGKPPITLKEMEFSLKPVAKLMGQPNISAFNKWKEVWVAVFLEKQHRSVIRGQNRLKQVRYGPLHWETAVADVLATLETWLLLVNFDNAESICQKWVEMFLKNSASKIWKARNKGRRDIKRPAMDSGGHAGKMVRSHFTELPNTSSMVMIHLVSNGNDMVLAPKQLQTLYTDVRHWEELVDFINKNSGLKE